MTSSRIKSYQMGWEESARIIAARGITGLQIECPKCFKVGTLISKWVKSTPTKPLYVIHYNGNGLLDACPLNRDESKNARSRINLNAKDIMKTLRIGKAFVLFSGGNDSLCLLEYMHRLGKQSNKQITALHVNTTAGLPEVEEYVKEVCKKMEVSLEIVKPLHDYFDLAKKWGIPGFRSRWCCKTLKIAPIRRFLQRIEEPKIVFDGIRAAESTIRATYVPIWHHPSFRCINVSPIFFWSDKKIQDYIKRQNLPLSPFANLRVSGECWCGAYKSRTDFEALLEIKPDFFDKLVDVEKAQRGKYTFIYEKGKQVPLISLKDGLAGSGGEIDHGAG